jgi:Vesicle coat protein involved in Golgi to plasma membrane transport
MLFLCCNVFAESPLEQFLRRRAHTPMRSLADLLGIDDIYAQIHRQFSYILKSSARRRLEKVTKGRRAGPLYIQMVSKIGNAMHHGYYLSDVTYSCS